MVSIARRLGAEIKIGGPLGHFPPHRFSLPMIWPLIISGSVSIDPWCPTT
jgi:hypothetical protein